MVSRLRPETWMVRWWEAGEPTCVSCEGAGWGVWPGRGCGRLGTRGLAALPDWALPARLLPVVPALRPSAPRLGARQREGVALHPTCVGWLPGPRQSATACPLGA